MYLFVFLLQSTPQISDNEASPEPPSKRKKVFFILFELCHGLCLSIQ